MSEDERPKNFNAGESTISGTYWSAEVYLICFLLLLIGLVWIAPSPFPDRYDILFELTLSIFLCLIVPLGYRSRPNNFWLLLRSGYLIFPILYSFRLMHFLIPVLRTPGFRFEKAIIEIDRWLFGADLETYLAPIRTPILTEAMQYFYLTYYVVPIVLLILFVRDYLKQNLSLSDIRFFAGSVVLGFLSSYAGYLLVPVLGPRYGLTKMETNMNTDLGELWFAEEIRHAINTLELKTYDAFPSGHTEIFFIVLVFAWMYHRRWFWGFLPLYLGMLASTVYLRYHYGIDLIAGLFLGTLVILFERWIQKKYSTEP